MLLRNRIVATAVVVAAMCGAERASAQSAFTLSSSSFKDGERLAVKYGASNKANPNCAGENISPALSWSNPPAGTKSYALVMFDADGRPPAGFVHWVAYGIRPSLSALAEGEGSKANDKYVAGQNSPKQSAYFGPCPPPGTVHHYVFTLFATDLEPTGLKEGMTREELVKAIEGHAKGATSLFATYAKP
jgi:Raf kinase inhibitor-like YbhB/YbcL family protein